MADKSYQMQTTLSDGRVLDSGTFTVHDGEDGTGFNWGGVWTSGSDHYVNDVVRSPANGNTYICIDDINPSNTDPASDTTHWQIFVEKGVKGDTGNNGTTIESVAKTVNSIKYTDVTGILLATALGACVSINIYTDEGIDIGPKVLESLYVPALIQQLDDSTIEIVGSGMFYDPAGTGNVQYVIYAWWTVGGAKGCRFTYHANGTSGDWNTINLNALKTQIAIQNKT